MSSDNARRAPSRPSERPQERPDAPSSGRGSSGASSNPTAPQPQRRSTGPVPGLSSIASSMRSNKTSSLSQTILGRSNRRSSSSNDIHEEDEEGEDEIREESLSTDQAPLLPQGRVDRTQLEEIRKGIFMPGLGGNRARTEAQQEGANAGPSKGVTSPGGGLSGAPASLGRELHGSRSVDDASALGISGAPAGGRTVAQNYGDQPFRSRAQPTLKASMLKKRAPNTASLGAASSQSATAKKPVTGPRMGQGTPARATRYSLPVRSEKPVRTSKVTGKHIVLPSESQLAPLPDEEEDEDEEDSSSSSSEDESDAELASHADEDEAVPEEGDEEAREEARQQLKKRREEAQARLEEARKQKEAQRQARKPKGVPGHPETGEVDGVAAKTPRTAAFRGPAHARAPPRVPKATGPVFHTFERLAPSARVHTPLPRLTSYAVAPAIHIPTLNGFLRREHSVKPRLYDECAYVVYFKPLLPGFGRANVRSAPEPRGGTPGAESRRERELVEREESGYVGSYFVNSGNNDEGDIDEQGYIHGGEGQGQEEEDERSRSHRSDAQLGSISETDGETGRGRKAAPDDELVSETEVETDVERDNSREASRERRQPYDGESEQETDALLGRSDVMPVEGTSYEDRDVAGGTTPRALGPRSHDEEVEVGELNELGEAAMPTASQDFEVSNADVAGAQDLLQQQHMIEQGTDDQRGMPEQRSPGPQHDEPRARSDAYNGANGSNGHAGLSRSAQRQHDREERRRLRGERKRARVQAPNAASHNHDTTPNMLTSRSIFEALQVAELIILPYGVLVMYNFTEHEERDIINDVISSGCVRGGAPLSADEEETEAFHFCYDPSVPAPRIFNDFFTFRGPNHLLKLSLAHAIAQSTKLSVFEESMQGTLELTSHIPKELAVSGELKLKRREALKLTGRLFKLRVDVNLTSNVLDTPELFWSEASLKALYDAIREYLEIDQRVENLNERLAVGNDLLEVIHDHLGSQSMDQITWIIIILIIVACFVAGGEITARLVLHARTKNEAASAVFRALGPAASTVQALPDASADGAMTLPSTSSSTLPQDTQSLRQLYYMLLAAAKQATEVGTQAAADSGAADAARLVLQS